MLKFDYYSQYGGMTTREAEPVQLLFKEYTWYLRAFCRVRQAMRLFKVVRMKRLEVLEETFVPEGNWFHGIGTDTLCETAETSEKTEIPEITVWIDKREAYRVYDRFEEEGITVLPEGDFLIRMRSFPDDWVYGLLLSFGPSAKVLAPEGVRTEMARRIKEMGKMYL